MWMNLWFMNGGELKAAMVSDSHRTCGEEIQKPENSVKCDDMEPCDNFQWSLSDMME